MSTSTKPLSLISLTNTSLMIWVVVIGVGSYYVINNAIPHILLNKAMYAQHWEHVIFLFSHVLAGTVALILGPLQFWSGLRNRYKRVHRFIGYTYFVCIFLSSLLALYLVSIPERTFGFRIGMGGLAVVWLLSTIMAYIAISKGKVLQHREWMVRSYVLTFGFVTFRFMLIPFFTLFSVSPDAIVDAVSWMCWVVPLVIAEFFIQGRKIFN